MRKLTTPLEIKEEIVRMLQLERVHFRGKIPMNIKDLPKRYTMPSSVNAAGDRIKNKYWTKARTTISNSKRPTRNVPKFDTKVKESPLDYVHTTSREERAKINNTTISITLPSGMSATDLIDLIAIIRKSGAKCSL
jgi:hypothetical protein